MWNTFLFEATTFFPYMSSYYQNHMRTDLRTEIFASSSRLLRWREIFSNANKSWFTLLHCVWWSTSKRLLRVFHIKRRYWFSCKRDILYDSVTSGLHYWIVILVILSLMNYIESVLHVFLLDIFTLLEVLSGK